MILLTIDVRERELIDKINELIPIDFKNTKLNIAALDLGDIIISDENGLEYLIIERKKISDLFASIKDGRYEEQSYRLSGINYPNHNIIYLIEGTLKVQDNKNLFYSSVFSLNFYKGFSVIRTTSLEESAFFILNSIKRIERNNKDKKYPLYGYYANYKNKNKDKDNNKDNDNNNDNEKLEKDNSDLSIEDAAIVDEKAYVACVKKVKKENITTKNINELMLSSIPNISPKIATLIMKKYGTIENMLKILREIGIDDLKTITEMTDKGKTKKLNKTVIHNIEKFLLS